MAEGPQVTLNIRLAPTVVARLDDLVAQLQDDPELAARGKVTRNGLIREAVLRWLPELEARAREAGR